LREDVGGGEHVGGFRAVECTCGLISEKNHAFARLLGLKMLPSWCLMPAMKTTT
jgi:hypothetical protein